MAENWEIKSLDRRIEALEAEKMRRAQRLNWWYYGILWTILVVVITTAVVLSATGNIHHH
jgi:hypothetical protein